MNYVNSLLISIFMSVIYHYVLIFVNYLIKMRHLVLCHDCDSGILISERSVVG